MTLMLVILSIVNPMFSQSTFDEQGLSGGAVAERVTKHPENVEVSLDWNVPDWARCPQHWSEARQAGWTEDQMPTLDYIMFRESRCNEAVVNYLGCKGLLQLCNWGCDGSCREALPNLKKGRELWEASGWRPWCLDGDRVTGNC